MTATPTVGPRTPLRCALGRALFSRWNSQRARMFARNRFRLLCPDVRLPVRTRFGFNINASPRDYASYGIYFFGDYDPRMTDAIRHLLRPGMTALDVGTERGWFTLLMSACVGKGGAVHGIEAFPPNAGLLRENLALNDFPQARVHEAGASDRAGVLHFEPPSREVTGGVAYLADCSGVGYLTDKPSGRSIEIPTLTLDELVDRERLTRVDFIKMDIEGAETAALRGSRELLRRFRPVLAVEYNRATLRRAGSSLEELDDLLASCGYDRLHLAATFRPVDLVRSRDLPDEAVVFNAYCFPRESAAAISRAA
jgi:FkbM family methyltransferase